MWQPIETAPKDGTPFLVWLDKPELGSHVHTWSQRTGKVCGTICGIMAFDIEGTPTHWQSLPEPPTN